MSRLIATLYGGRGMIFVLHSIVDDATFYPDYTLRCSADKLEWILDWLRNDGLQFVSLDEAVRLMGASNSRRFAAFTFDDGFADNLTRALPIMERFGAHAWDITAKRSVPKSRNFHLPRPKVVTSLGARLPGGIEDRSLLRRSCRMGGGHDETQRRVFAAPPD